jgi:hypothetical protein
MQKATKKAVNNTAKKMSQNLSNIFANTPKGMAVNVGSNVKGKDIEKAKRELSALQISKISANKLHKSFIGGFRFILDSFKDRGTTYLKELNAKHELSATMEQIMTLKPSDLCALMTEKEKERQAKNGNLWSFWQVETLIARYLKASK